jgi:hypothetical protein
VFPNGQFVHIIRDCYDVVSSYLKSGIKHDVSDAAIRWVESIKLIKKFSSDYSISFYELKYEDLVNNPEYEIKNLCDFLNINFSNEMIDSSPDEGLGDVEMREHHKNVKEKINSNSIGKGRDILSKKDIEKINRIAEKTITKMGYSVITL